MSTQISIDMSSAIPPFEQVRSQLAALISAGILTPGTRLPTVRDLAADLGIAVGTVTRAYRELETLGLDGAEIIGTIEGNQLSVDDGEETQMVLEKDS